MSDLDAFYVHTLTVQTYQGEGSDGPMYAAGVAVPGFLDTTANLVRTGSSDEATAASSMFYCAPTYAALFSVQSLVASASLAGDGKAIVVKVNSLDSGTMSLPDHVEVTLL
jgi:hypothetical protein